MARRPQRGQTGQALAEFLAASVVLVPLFMLLPMIGKYQDLSHVTQMASRYVAFDATWFGDIDGENPWKSPTQLADEVRRRFYSNADAPIKTGNVAGDFEADGNPFWQDPSGRRLIAHASDVVISFGNDSTSQDAGFEDASDGKPFSQAPLAAAGKIGLAARGMYTGNVSVSLANLPYGIENVAPFNALNLSIRRHTSFVFDPWSSPTTDTTEKRVARLAPIDTTLSFLSPKIKAAILVVEGGEANPAGTDPGDGEKSAVTAPRFGDLSEWRDVVPSDRLIPVR